MRYTLNEFEAFLKGIDLDLHREQYSKIKTVEMDLPKNIQALDTIYEVYWNKDSEQYKKPLSFDEFYDVYYEKCKENILIFWEKSGFGMDCQCFPRGLKARIYRTWASLITQIHAGYVAESVFGKDSVEMGTELDHQDIDFLINYKNKEIKIQVKKDSKRPEIARMHSGDTDNGDIYYIWYIVPSAGDYNFPYYKVKAKAGQLRDCVKSFIKYNPDNGTLDRLDNGFVIFTTKEFELIKENFD